MNSPHPVREQYEAYSYPERDPRYEETRPLPTALGHLPEINFYCFNGKRDFRRSRVLVAGCGTGDGAIFLAEQLRHREAELVCLDMSEQSLKIAKERAKIRGLPPITWIRDS